MTGKMHQIVYNIYNVIISYLEVLLIAKSTIGMCSLKTERIIKNVPVK